MTSYTNAVLSEVAYAFRKLSQYTPDAAIAFQKLLEATLEKGALPLKVKELVLVGIGIALRCEPCVVHHVKKALEAGATPQEIAEVIALAVLMGGGPVAASSAKAFKALEELIKRE